MLLNVENLISEDELNLSGCEKEEKEELNDPEFGLKDPEFGINDPELELGFTEYLEINSSILGL